MNINSILQVLCPPQEQFLLWVSFWGLCCTGCCSSGRAGHEVQTLQGGQWLPGEVSCQRTARLAPAVDRGPPNTYTPMSLI